MSPLIIASRFAKVLEHHGIDLEEVESVELVSDRPGLGTDTPMIRVRFRPKNVDIAFDVTPKEDGASS